MKLEHANDVKTAEHRPEFPNPDRGRGKHAEDFLGNPDKTLVPENKIPGAVSFEAAFKPDYYLQQINYLQKKIADYASKAVAAEQKGDKRTADSYRLQIKQCERDIERNQKAYAEALKKEAANAAKKKNGVSFGSDAGKLNSGEIKSELEKSIAREEAELKKLEDEYKRRKKEIIASTNPNLDINPDLFLDEEIKAINEKKKLIADLKNRLLQLN